MPEVESQSIGATLCQIINGTDEEDVQFTIVSEAGGLFSSMRAVKFMCEVRIEDQLPQEIILVAKWPKTPELFHFVWLNAGQKATFHPATKDVEHIPIKRLFVGKS